MTAPAKSPPAPRGGGKTRIVVTLLLGMALGRVACAPDAPAAGGALDAAGATHAPAHTRPAAPATIWTCAMDPQVRLPDPGSCPICSMDLIPLAQGDNDGLSPRALRVSENAAALAGLVTAPVERRAIERQVRMVGRVAFDETRLSYITAWVPSRLDRLFVDFTGVRVRKGDHLAEVYSPNLIATQQELLAAVRGQQALSNGGLEIMRERQADSVRSARERLRLWGLSSRQIDEIVEGGEPLEHITINAPVGGVVVHKNALQGEYVETGTRIYTIADLSHVWVVLEAYEKDLAWLHYGQHVDFVTESWPGETFSGRVSFLDPVLDDRTRTVKVRVNVDNSEMRLKPDMFVRATVLAPMTSGGWLADPELAGRWMCPMHPEAMSDEAGACPTCGMDLAPTEELGFTAVEPGELPLVIPATAPLLTGERAVVYVRLPGDGPPVFEGREVILGPRAGDDYVVKQGLALGELVVVRGAFKLDSELQIRARPSMMSPAGGAPAPGHDHGGTAQATHESMGAMSRGRPAGSTALNDVTDSVVISTPVAFRHKLGELLPPLVQASRALANDDAPGARAAAGTLVAAVQAVPMTALDAPAHAAWMPLSRALGDAAAQLRDASDIAAQRVALRDAHRAAISALRSFGWEGGAANSPASSLPASDASDTPAQAEAPAIFHCPMAFDGEGADWIDTGTRVANPYYGSAMLRCGSLTQSLRREP
ncbi:MAG: efflux transporter periplasmic adaptor subunit [Planctomycetota bacterium]|nr:MAG: efflux transporter periplasmic adaptor subunit [Planctomycetota bacterium]